ncbi:MAG TPA: hypothetical protein VLC09_02825 [Polyangiaceae bacterium]|nr:hypothetical protein [Polyangiaceae bacterium]
MSKDRQPEQPADKGPAVSFREEPAGRETLEAISHERRVKEARSTKHYGDRISNAPGAVSPRVALALDTHPEVTFAVVPAGRATYAALEDELHHDGPSIEIRDAREPVDSPVLAMRIERMCTFVVQAPVEQLESPVVQSELLRERLLPFLPVDDPRHVSRVEVRAWQDAGTTLVRVWCRVP